MIGCEIYLFCEEFCECQDVAERELVLWLKCLNFVTVCVICKPGFNVCVYVYVCFMIE